MTQNGAGFDDASCVLYYRALRDGVPSNARQIGYGVNKWPVSPALRDYFLRLYGVLFSDRMTEYDSAWDKDVRELIAWLASEYLQVPGLDESQVVLCHGTTEAISIACGFAARRGLVPVLPLPVYYAFEQSAIRSGLGSPVYYDPHGRHVGEMPPQTAAMLVDVAPNGVLGTWFRPPELMVGATAAGDQRAGYRHVLIDHVFSLPTFQPRDDFLAQLRGRVRAAPDHTVFLTPSKDFSLPGVRSGVMLTTNPDLVAHAQADRFERGYAVHGGIGPIAAGHLAIVLLSFTDRREFSAMLRRIRAAFTRTALPFPAEEEIRSILADGRESRSLFFRNLETLYECDFLSSVAGAETPAAGYSTFRWIEKDFGSPEIFTNWLNFVGRAGLKLNANYLFGADPAIWEEVYPERYGIRLNISVSAEEMSANLALLRSAL
ncbi:aminotransferase class I/II-fold pyridoxal phosphate-dependent enzyme [Streptomyces cyaneofuscatus]|uniref:aminotransferase class I/II-fold pyridoxal phosphate-dependent enzyme n=1 Tax=Streptomyces cyaneofuscatus TaxID=66883 RepID=UPI0033AD3BB4